MSFICPSCEIEFEPESNKEHLLMLYSIAEGQENPCQSCLSYLLFQLEEVERASLERLVDNS